MGGAFADGQLKLGYYPGADRDAYGSPTREAVGGCSFLTTFNALAGRGGLVAALATATGVA